MTNAFIDPRPLYSSGVDLTTRVGVFGRYLRLEEETWESMVRITEAVRTRRPAVDVGCGVAVPLLPVGPTMFTDPTMTGIDLSLRQLASIREQGPHALVASADAELLPFASQSFSLALARHMLYHFDDPRAAAREIARVLTDDGVLLATTNSSTSRPELQNAHHRALAELGGGHVVKRISDQFSAEGGSEVLADAFDQVETVPWAGRLQFPTREAVLGYYRSAAYFQRSYDDPARREQLAAAVGEILEAGATEEGIALTVHGAMFLAEGPRRTGTSGTR